MSDLVHRRFISIAEIQHAVAAAFSLTRADLLSRSREQRIACARHVAMYLSREWLWARIAAGAARLTIYPPPIRASGWLSTAITRA